MTLICAVHAYRGLSSSVLFPYCWEGVLREVRSASMMLCALLISAAHVSWMCYAPGDTAWMLLFAGCPCRFD